MAKVYSLAAATYLLLGLSGCAAMSGQNGRNDNIGVRPVGADANSVVTRAQEPSPEENRAVHRDLVQKMLEQGQYYAALAHIEDLKRSSGDSLELRYLEAEAKRNLNQTADALKLYNSLLNTQFDGQAHHGLGLLTFSVDRIGAVQHLRMAVQRQPTDSQFRNDLGFALMQSGRYSEALPELATAVELNPGNLKARNNLLVMLIASGNAPRARQLASESGMSDQDYAAAQKSAESFAQSIAQSGHKR